MSILEHGLPAHFFTRKRAALAGLCIGLTFLVLNELYAKAHKYLSEPQVAPACYGDILRAGRTPIPPRHTYSPDGRSIDDRQASFDLQKTTAGLAACTVNSCPKEGWRTYRSAIFLYLSSRLQHTSRLYLNYGDAGLARSREIYSNPIDRQVIESLSSLKKKGVFRLNDFTQQRAAIAILALNGADALRPCTSGDVPEKSY